MRKYLDIDLAAKSVDSTDVSGEDAVKVGRYLSARMLVDNDIATVDPLGPENLLIMSVGPFAGTSFSNANRTSVGCKSPLTGGIKEANGGGTFGYALGQLQVSCLTLRDVAADWTVIHLKNDGSVAFDDASPYMGRGNYETAELLYEKYGRKVALALCGPVGEYEGLLAAIAFSDNEGRPSRFAARGGVGAVMGSKKVKAIVADLDRIPALHDRKKTFQGVRDYAKLLQADSVVMKFYNAVGTMGMADYQNVVGGLPVRNFSAGQQVDPEAGEFRMGGDYIGDLNTSRGGSQTHACMPGCVIQCSNVYHDADGNEVVSPVEYETLGLLGTNCGISDPDHLAGLNEIANDLGIDTIEAGATLAVLMEAGLAEFGDVDWMAEALAEIRAGTENGRIWAQGTARVGEAYGVERVPVIKKQAISAYDPRVVEATGITMMVTAQGADHTVGNLPRLDTASMSLQELMDQSLAQQTKVAVGDSLGLCMFGQTVTNANVQFITDAINAAQGTSLAPDFFLELGRETLRLERDFNRKAGFGVEDDELPNFFYDEPLPPTGRVARFHAEDVHGIYDNI